MIQYTDIVKDERSQLPIEGAQVFVYTVAENDNDAPALAVLYAADGTTPIPNPLTTNNLGVYSFYNPASELIGDVYVGGRLRYRSRLFVGGGYSGAAHSAASAAANAVGRPAAANTGAGLAATAIGETFWINNGDGTGTTYRHDPGPVATVVGKFVVNQTSPGAADLLAGGIPTTTALASPTGGEMVGIAVPYDASIPVLPVNTQDWLAKITATTVSCADYMTGNGTGDLGAVLQDIHDNRLGPDGGRIVLPAGSSHWLMTTAFVPTKPFVLEGLGWRNSQILITTNALVAFQISNLFTIRGVDFLCFGAAATTAIPIKVLGTATGHNYSIVEDCNFEGGATQVQAIRANKLRLNLCAFGSYVNYGADFGNTTNADEGDCMVTNCEFAGGTATSSIGMRSRNAGLYWMNNKGLGAHDCVLLVDTDNGDIGNYNIHGGSLEGYANSAIRFRTSGGHTNTKIQIIGVQMSSSSTYCVDIGGTTENVILNGNICNRNGSSAGTSAFKIGTDVRDVTIDGNAVHDIESFIEAPSTDVGMTIGRSNRINSSVTYALKGGTDHGNAPQLPTDIEIALTKAVTSNSTATWSDVFKWKGAGRVRIMAQGLVQGVGYGRETETWDYQGTSLAQFGATTTLGTALDTQLVISGSDIVLQVRTNAGTGGTITNFTMTCIWDGFPRDVRYA